MPCCLATLQFRQCSHSMLLKLGCTKSDCTAICPSKRKQFLFRARYMWRCEDCVDHEYSQSSDSRAGAWDEYYAKLDADSSIPKESRKSITLTKRQKESDEDAIEEHRRLRCVMEIQMIVDWVEEYSQLLWNLAYNKEADVQKSWARVEFLRHAKPWDLIVNFDFLRDPSKPWDVERYPACIEQLVLAPAKRLDTQATSPGQLGTVRNTERPRAPLFSQSTRRAEDKGERKTSTLYNDITEVANTTAGILVESPGPGSDPELLAPRLVFSEDSAKETEAEDTERCSDNDCVGDKMDVDVQGADSPEILGTPHASSFSYEFAACGCLREYSTAQADDEDADDETEPNYVF